MAEAAAVAGDLLATVGSAIPFVGGPLAGIQQTMVNRETRKRLKFLEDLVAELRMQFEGRLDVLEENLKDPARREMVLDATDKAANVPDGEPRELLVQVVADGLETNDAEQLALVGPFVDVISELRPEHLVVLREMGNAPNGGTTRRLHMAEKWSAHALEAKHPELRGVVEALAARLVALGLAYESGTAGGSTEERPAGQPQYGLTRSGVELLRYGDGATS